MSSDDDLERTVQDKYIVYVARNAERTAEQANLQYAALLQRAEELQQQHGAEKFLCYRKFEFVRGIAAVIRGDDLVELLQKEGYTVERQPEVRTTEKFSG